LGGGFAVTSPKEDAMPNPTTNAQTSSAQSPLADTQTLISLLTSLMPLLQRMQEQINGQAFISPNQFAFGQFPFGQAPFDQAPFGQAPFGQGNFQGNPAPVNPQIDHQAAVNFVEDVTGDALRNLSAYLDTHAEQHTELATCVTVVTQAARSFAVRDYSQAFAMIWQAYRMIAAARAVNPQLPPLRPASQAGTASSPPLN
jgi:hypothetical protein